MSFFKLFIKSIKFFMKKIQITFFACLVFILLTSACLKQASFANNINNRVDSIVIAGRCYTCENKVNISGSELVRAKWKKIIQ